MTLGFFLHNAGMSIFIGVNLQKRQLYSYLSFHSNYDDESSSTFHSSPRFRLRLPLGSGHISVHRYQHLPNFSRCQSLHPRCKASAVLRYSASMYSKRHWFLYLQNFLKNFANTDVLAFVARVGLLFQMSFTFPLLLYITRLQLVRVLLGRDETL